MKTKQKPPAKGIFYTYGSVVLMIDGRGSFLYRTIQTIKGMDHCQNGVHIIIPAIAAIIIFLYMSFI